MGWRVKFGFKISSMYFDGPAARWFQSIERTTSSMGWHVFCKLINDRFGRDLHELLIRQLFHIHRTSTVAEYVDRFAQLVDQLSAYTTSTDPLYYTLRFIDGLRDDIKSIILVQRPRDLDTACVLAALQEEVGDSPRRRDLRRPDTLLPPKPASKGPLPLPTPRAGPSTVGQALDRRGADSAHAGSSPESRASALRAYHRAMGLCYQCGEKWHKEHTCAPTVQLHMVKELWELFQLEDELHEPSPESPDSSDQLFLAISKAVASGVPAPRTVKFLGSIQHRPVTLLVDSGSSSSFISCQLAAQLSEVSPLSQPISVKVAGGGTLSFSSVLPQAHWFIGDISFHSDLKVLPLTTYDMIIGMDWL